MKFGRLFVPALLIALLHLPSAAQQTDSTLLTLERIFSSREFLGERFGPARWVDNGSGYTTLEPSPELKGGTDIIRYDTATGRRNILVEAKLLVPAGASTALAIASYEWSPDRQRLLIFTNTLRVWRQNTRGDYWVVDLKTWQMQKLGGEAGLLLAPIEPLAGNRAHDALEKRSDQSGGEDTAGVVGEEGILRSIKQQHPDL
jgi:dipeptidyl-peptidase-4